MSTITPTPLPDAVTSNDEIVAMLITVEGFQGDVYVDNGHADIGYGVQLNSRSGLIELDAASVPGPDVRTIRDVFGQGSWNFDCGIGTDGVTYTPTKKGTLSFDFENSSKSDAPPPFGKRFEQKAAIFNAARLQMLNDSSFTVSAEGFVDAAIHQGGASLADDLGSVATVGTEGAEYFSSLAQAGSAEAISLRNADFINGWMHLLSSGQWVSVTYVSPPLGGGTTTIVQYAGPTRARLQSFAQESAPFDGASRVHGATQTLGIDSPRPAAKKAPQLAGLPT